MVGVIISIWSLAVANTDYGGNSTAGAAILLVSSLISLGLCVCGIIGGILMNRLFLVIVSGFQPLYHYGLTLRLLWLNLYITIP